MNLRWSILGAFVAVLLAVAVVPSRPAGAAQTQPPPRYQSVFYPDGMPLRPGWDGKDRRAIYHLLADLDLAGRDAAVVLYAEEIVTGGSDNLFSVSLALVERRNNVTRSRTSLELTRFLPVQVEQAGNVHHVRGTLNGFAAAAGVNAIHVNLWAVISGSGSIGGAADLFFAVDTGKGSFTALLELVSTSRFSRAGPELADRKDVDIYLANVDQDAAIEIVVNSIDLTPGRPAGRPADMADVYKLIKGRYQIASARMPRAKLPRTAVLLKRSPEIAEIVGR